MEASEYKPEFNPAAFYQFMLESELFRMKLAKSEKIKIIRQQRNTNTERSENTLLKAESEGIELEQG